MTQHINESDAAADSIETTLTIVYPEWTNRDPDEWLDDETIPARIERHETDVLVFNRETDERIIGYRIEERSNTRIALSALTWHSTLERYTTNSIRYPTLDDATAIRTGYVKRDEEYMDRVRSPELTTVIEQTLADERERFATERDIKPLAAVDPDETIPALSLAITRGPVPTPSSKTGTLWGTYDGLRTELATESDRHIESTDAVDVFEWWCGAIARSCNRYETHLNGVLKAPPGYTKGDRLSLREWLDAWYSIDPIAVLDAADEIRTEEREQDERAAERERSRQAREQRSDRFDLTLTRRYDEGRGETHALKADVEVTDHQTGATGAFTLRNAVDIGWQAFPADDAAEAMVDAADDRTPPAQVFLREHSPISTGFRMTEHERGRESY